MKTLKPLFLFLLLSLCAADAEDLIREYPASQRFGMNLSGVNWYQSQYPFWDAMKTAREWRGFRADNDQYAVPLDEKGYPILEEGQVAATWVLNRYYPAGQYVLTYDGEFDLLIEFGGVEIVSQEPGRVVLEGDPDSYLRIQIWNINPENPPRNWHLWLPGYDPETTESPFHPSFVRLVKPFKTLRFMDWLETNNNPIENWSERIPHDYFTWANDGIPIEVCIELANTIDAQPWFCIPEKATDDYIRQFAETVHAQLEPDLPCIVEYSNEVFNWAFSVSRHASTQGRLLRLAKDEELEGIPSQDRAGIYAQRFYGLKTSRIKNIWSDVFGADAARVRTVVTGKADQLPWAMNTRIDAQGGLSVEKIDLIAGNSYWGFGHAREIPTPYDDLTVDDVFDFLEEDLRTTIRPKMQALKEFATLHGKKLMVYEGGQHLSEFGGGYETLSPEDRAKLEAVSLACQSHPRMGELMQQDWDIWLKEGETELYCAFSHISYPTGAYAWGMWEAQGQPLEEAVKAAAYIEYVRWFDVRGRPFDLNLRWMASADPEVRYWSPQAGVENAGAVEWSVDLDAWSRNGITQQYEDALYGGVFSSAILDPDSAPEEAPAVFFRVVHPVE